MPAAADAVIGQNSKRAALNSHLKDITTAMFKKILAPIQNLENDEIVFEKALTLAKENHAELMLLHVFAPSDPSVPGLPNPMLYRYPLVTDELMKGFQDRWEETENQGLEMLKGLSDRAQSVGLTPEFSQNVGSVGTVVCHLADSWEADLVVIRQPDRSKLDELLLGSVSHYILHHAPCAVLTITSSK